LSHIRIEPSHEADLEDNPGPLGGGHRGSRLHCCVREAVDVSSLEVLRKLQTPGKPDAVARIISHFLKETDERLAALIQAAAAGDARAVERSAHALKGITGTVGANEMLDLAVRLEHIGREGHTVGAADLVTELESALGRARPIFNRLREAS
jgi:HPt (histidine-containing phosphotransfer) domain-containing protein